MPKKEKKNKQEKRAERVATCLWQRACSRSRARARSLSFFHTHTHTHTHAHIDTHTHNDARTNTDKIEKEIKPRGCRCKRFFYPGSGSQPRRRIPYNAGPGLREKKKQRQTITSLSQGYTYYYSNYHR